MTYRVRLIVDYDRLAQYRCPLTAHDWTFTFNTSDVFTQRGLVREVKRNLSQSVAALQGVRHVVVDQPSTTLVLQLVGVPYLVEVDPAD